MGLCLDPDETNGVSVEIRRESVMIHNPDMKRNDVFGYDGAAEISKYYLKMLVEFFTQHPEHLQ